MKSLFLDLEFPRGMGDQVEKSWKFQGMGGVTRSPQEWKIQWGGGSNWKKPSVGEVWIFSGTIQCQPLNENGHELILVS